MGVALRSGFGALDRDPSSYEGALKSPYSSSYASGTSIEGSKDSEVGTIATTFADEYGEDYPNDIADEYAADEPTDTAGNLYDDFFVESEDGSVADYGGKVAGSYPDGPPFTSSDDPGSSVVLGDTIGGSLSEKTDQVRRIGREVGYDHGLNAKGYHPESAFFGELKAVYEQSYAEGYVLGQEARKSGAAGGKVVTTTGGKVVGPSPDVQPIDGGMSNTSIAAAGAGVVALGLIGLAVMRSKRRSGPRSNPGRRRRRRGAR